jgi:hypothetical protein
MATAAYPSNSGREEPALTARIAVSAHSPACETIDAAAAAQSRPSRVGRDLTGLNLTQMDNPLSR